MSKSSISALIEVNQKNFSKKELLISSYLMEFKSSTSNLDVKTLLKETQTSYSTLYNFLKKLGLNNFKELLLGLKVDEIEKEDNVNLLSSQNRVSTEINNAYLAVLNENSKNIPLFILDSIIDAIYSHKNIYFIGLGESALVCQELSSRLINFGIKSNVIDRDTGRMVLTVMSLKEDDLLIAVSFSGETKIITECSKIAKKRNVDIFCITADVNSTLAKMNKNVLPIYYSYSKSKIKSWVSALLPAIYLIDLISFRILEEHGDILAKYHKEATEYIDGLVQHKKNN